MASAGIESSSGESLEARIARATLERSRALLRIGLEIPAWDPWRCLERARDGARPWFAWSSGDGRERLLALGAVAHQPASRANGWSDCDEFCSAVSEQSVHVDLTLETPAPRDMPLIVGGMSFSARGAHAPESDRALQDARGGRQGLRLGAPTRAAATSGGSSSVTVKEAPRVRDCLA